MAVILEHDNSRFGTGDSINLAALKSNTARRNATGLIAPAAQETKSTVLEEHSAEPIKNMEDIIRISQFLVENGRYRDNMLFIVGINFGLRVSDLLELSFAKLITDSFAFRDCFPVFEKKTRHTRKRKHNRYVTINNAVIDAVTLYLEHTPGVTLSDYMFTSESNHGANKGEPLTAWSVNRILKGIARDLGITTRVSTHTLRKTFGYHQMVMGGNSQRTLLLLQKIYGHSTPAQTLEYIGITDEEISEAYNRLNLGSSTANYLVDSRMVERDAEVG